MTEIMEHLIITHEILACQQLLLYTWSMKYLLTEPERENINMIEQPNQAFRMDCKRCGIPLWKIAQKAGVSEQTLIRWLRVELTGDRYLLLKGIVGEMRKEIMT